MAYKVPMLPASQNNPCPGLYHMPPAMDGKLCRIRLEQGCLTGAQLCQLAHLAATHGNGIIELTSRANIQLRGIKQGTEASLINALEQAGLAPKIPAGDGVRNVMVNPTAGFDPQAEPQILPLAQQISTILQTTPAYQTLSPKFSILLDGGEACAIIHHISDIWLSLCDEGKNFAFGLASRPPLVGEVSTTLGKVPANQAQTLILALVDMLLEIRETQPQIERMKHLLAAYTSYDIAALLQQKCPFVTSADNFRRAPPKPHAHLGINPTNTFKRLYLGIKPPLGRLNPTTAHFIADKMPPELELRLTPWHSIIVPHLEKAQAQALAQTFALAGFITSDASTLAHIVCCAGSPSCAAAKAQVHLDAEQLAQSLGNINFAPIHLTGCAKSCAANEATATTLLARGQGIYDLFQADKKASSPFGRLIARALTIKQAAEWLAQKRAEFLPESHR